ncbi:MAG: hypothetical protein H6R02_1340 [Burkholderiaceae bacterium]|jgi:hypothetical protein|nr:hypothetical protein [Burkholderiaceae bacterium]
MGTLGGGTVVDAQSMDPRLAAIEPGDEPSSLHEAGGVLRAVVVGGGIWAGLLFAFWPS